MNLAHKVVIAISIPVVFQIGFFWFVLDSVHKLDQLEHKQRETTRVLMLRDQMFVAENEQLLYYGIYRATLKPEYVSKFQECAAKFDSAFDQLFQIWKDSEVRLYILRNGWRQHKIIDRFAKDLLHCDKQTTMSKLLWGETALPLGPFMMISDSSGNLSQTFEKIEHSQSDLKREAQSAEEQLKKLLLLGLLVFLLISLASGLLFSRAITNRLKKVVSNINEMETHEHSLLQVGGADEIAALNRAILDTDKKIRAAEEFQAQTARIVGQELERPIEHLSAALSELLEAGFESINENGKERVERSAQELRRLRTLVKDLVSLDKIKRAGWDLEIQAVDLAEIARAAVDTVQDFARSLNIEVVSELSESRVQGDPVRLHQIALNLLTNAIKFSMPNKTIEVETKIEGGFGKLSVTDHGTGIPEDFQQSIFGKFEQANRADSTEKGGSGLGLSISKKLVESLNGKMGFKSQLGTGSTFWLMLPSSPSPEEGTAIQDPSTPRTLAAFSDGDSAKAHSAKKRAMKAGDGFHPTLGRKVLALVFAPLFVQVLTIGSLWLVVGSICSNVNEFNRASQITSLHSSLLNAIVRATLDSMGYNASHSFIFLQALKTEHKLISELFDKLSAVYQSDKVLSENLSEVKRIIRENIDLQFEIVNSPQDANLDRWFGPSVCETTGRRLEALEKPLQVAIAQEAKLVEGNIFAKMSYRKNVEAVLLISMFSMFLLSVALGVFMTSRLTRRVSRIAANAERLGVREPLFEPPAGTDEVAYVDHAFFNAANKLIQLERFKQEIIAITSHEFRTPLTSLLAKTDLMEAGVFGVLTDRGREIVRSAKRSITELIALITNLLDVEKIQSGKNIVEKEEASIDALLSEVAENLLGIAEEHGVEIRAESALFFANVDKARLAQALMAVVQDIIMHAPAGASILLDAKVQDGHLYISIVAPGGQCSREALDVSSARGRLAVDLMKLIAGQHGGSSEVESTADRQLVTIRLPMHQAI